MQLSNEKLKEELGQLIARLEETLDKFRQRKNVTFQNGGYYQSDMLTDEVKQKDKELKNAQSKTDQI